jgi:ABC-type sugar transport system substrate-binding protein
MLEDSLLARPDAIVLHPVQPPTTIPYVQRGAEDGIAFFVSMMPPIVDGELQEDVVAYIGNYQLKRGPIQGQYILDWAEAQGRPIKVSEMWGLYGFEEFSGPVHRTLQETVAAGYGTMTDNPMIEEWWDWGDTMFTEDLSYQVCLDGLTANPDVDLIYCECDCMTGGVIAALKAMDLYLPADDPDHIAVVTGDAEDWSLAELEAGYIDCQVDMNIDRYTDGLVKAIWWYVVMGESMEDVNTSFGRAGPDFDPGTSARNIDVDDSLVTIDNVVEVRAKWASYGKDYYNWPLVEDEKFIKYPTP